MTKKTNDPNDNWESNSIENEQVRVELEKVIAQCPAVIQNAVNQYRTVDEKIMALFAMTGISGTLMPNIYFKYDSRTAYLLLMMLFVYPPASGKGGLSVIRKALTKINNEYLNQNKQQLSEYYEHRKKYKQEIKNDQSLQPPVKLPMPILLVPGNITSAKLIEQLNDNGPNRGLLIFETEADTFGVSASNNQHGGQLSTILRQAFHSESVSQARKTEGETLIADTPKLGVILSGTDNQVTRIFSSNADGLYSRFIIVSGEGMVKWKDVSPKENEQTLDDYFTKLADAFFTMWKHFEHLEAEVLFTADQWKRINDFGTRHLGVHYNFSGEYTGSIVKRHANILARIAATFTMLKAYEENNSGKVILCTDRDFDSAMWMAEYSLGCSISLYKKLPGNKDGKAAAKKNQLLKQLPESFSVHEIQSEEKYQKIPKRTLQRWLSQFTESGLLDRESHGHYKKTELAQLALAQSESNTE